ncbi:MAG TPA: peptidyl-prolyl cis-trans isomerase [Steroidobacteraceae bacterium]|nr:peptidyl-prolyl cis-trans isomerase [Steroidobacteraceae bacterium]
MNSIALPLSRSSWTRLWREPLVHFALIGAAIFVVAHAVEQRRQAAELRIEVDSSLDERLGNLYRTQFGASASAAQLRSIVDDYLDDEVLYRESLRLGLDQDDEIIRRRLIQKLEFLQRDSIASANPSTHELRAYYDAHPGTFAVPPRVSFAQLYFSPDAGGEARALARAREARVALAAGNPVDADAAFDPGYDAVTRADAARVFGASPLVDALFATPAGQWSEPVRSGFGWHLVRVTAVEPARELPFEQVLPDVRGAFLHDATAKARRAQLDQLRARYHVVAKTTP